MMMVDGVCAHASFCFFKNAPACDFPILGAREVRLFQPGGQAVTAFRVRRWRHRVRSQGRTDARVCCMRTPIPRRVRAIGLDDRCLSAHDLVASHPWAEASWLGPRAAFVRKPCSSKYLARVLTSLERGCAFAQQSPWTVCSQSSAGFGEAACTSNASSSFAIRHDWCNCGDLKCAQKKRLYNAPSEE